jgi:hypothetical protein
MRDHEVTEAIVMENAMKVTAANSNPGTPNANRAPTIKLPKTKSSTKVRSNNAPGVPRKNQRLIFRIIPVNPMRFAPCGKQ